MATKVVNKKTKKATPRFIGRYIVTDPEICHGKPTFRGTRIMVSHVLEQVAEGTAWETITQEWRGSVTKDAIAEAVRLASQAFLERTCLPGSGRILAPPFSDEHRRLAG